VVQDAAWAESQNILLALSEASAADQPIPTATRLPRVPQRHQLTPQQQPHIKPTDLHRHRRTTSRDQTAVAHMLARSTQPKPPVPQDTAPQSTPDDWRAAVASVSVEQPYRAHAVDPPSASTASAAAAVRLRLPAPPSPFEPPPPLDWPRSRSPGDNATATASASHERDGGEQEWARSNALAEYSSHDARPAVSSHRRPPAPASASAAREEEAFGGGWDEDEDDKLNLSEPIRMCAPPPPPPAANSARCSCRGSRDMSACGFCSRLRSRHATATHKLRIVTLGLGTKRRGRIPNPTSCA
jgi:hypothetical protein